MRDTTRHLKLLRTLTQGIQDSVVYYHKNCFDGLIAAYMFYSTLRDTAKYIPINYGDTPNPEDYTNKKVYIVDFSFPRDTLLTIKHAAKSFVLLDHHDSATRHFEGIDGCYYNPNLSGAGMAYHYLYSAINSQQFLRAKPQPKLSPNASDSLRTLAEVIQDYDLFRFAYPETEAYRLGLDTELAAPQTPEESMTAFTFIGTKLMYKPISELAERYQPLVAYRSKLNQQALNHVVAMQLLPDIWVDAVATSAPILTGKLGEAIYSKNPHKIAAIYSESKDLINVSLRCSKTRVCNSIAVAFEGGGHKQASGFRINRALWYKMLQTPEVAYSVLASHYKALHKPVPQLLTSATWDS